MALWHWDGGMALTDVSIIDHPVGEGRRGEEGEGCCTGTGTGSEEI